MLRSGLSVIPAKQRGGFLWWEGSETGWQSLFNASFEPRPALRHGFGPAPPRPFRVTAGLKMIEPLMRVGICSSRVHNATKFTGSSEQSALFTIALLHPLLGPTTVYFCLLRGSTTMVNRQIEINAYLIRMLGAWIDELSVFTRSVCEER